MGSRRDRDGGQMHVLESVLIGLVMVAAVSFVVTFSAPTSTTEPTRQRLDAQASDALAVLNEYPLNEPRYGNNTLAKMIFDCLQQKCTNLTSRLNGLLPSAVAYNVYINNGYAYLPVYEEKLPQGEAVSVRYPLEPRLTYVWMQTATEEVAPNLRTTLGVYALPVWNSNVLSDGGAGIEVRVQGYNNANQRSFNLTAFYSTQQGPDLPSASLVWWDHAGKSGLTVDKLGNLGKPNFTLELRESAGKSIRKGTTLSITVPRGFALEAWRSPQDSGWWKVNASEVALSGTASGGMTLATELKKDLPANTAILFRYNATSVLPNAPPDVYDFYSHNARLGNGAYSIADLLVRYSTHATATGGDFHSIVASIPKPMGTTATSRFAVAVQSPILPNPSETITITRIEILQPEGHRIFQSATAVGAAHGGTWSVSGGGPSSAIVWQGAKSMLPNEFISLSLDVTGSGVTTPGVPKEHQLASIATPTSRTLLPRQVGPGLFYGEVPPNQIAPTPLSGYYWPPVGGQKDIALLSDVRPVSAKTTVLPGAWNYDVATAATLRDSLSLINITLSDRILPIGETITIDVDAQNLLLNLSERGINAKTRIRLYAPQSLDSHIPILDGTTEEKSIFEAATQQILLHDYTGDGVKDVVVITTDGGIYVLNGKNGYKIPGLSARLTSGGAAGHITSAKIAYLETSDVSKERAYLVLGSEPTNTGFNLHVLNPAFTIHFQSRVALLNAGSQTVASVDAIPDLNADGWHDIALGDAAGAWFYIQGGGAAAGTTINSGMPVGTPPTSGALVAHGIYGVGPVDGITATTGLAVNAFRDFTLDASTFPRGAGGVLENLKKVNVDASDGGLVAIDGEMRRLWNYGTAVDVYRTVDLDSWGATDVVAGASDGSVAALNGTQAALPYNGVTILSGTKILDSATLADDPHRVWTVGNDGLVMSTQDGWTTRAYSTDAAGSGSLVATPGARAIHMASKDVGYVVGDNGKLWVTYDGSDEGADDGVPARWTPATIAIAGRESENTLWTLRDVWAFGTDDILVVGECAGCSGPVIFRLTPGGGWTTPILLNGAFTTNDAFTRLHFVDATTGFAATKAGLVFRTTDGGHTWQNLGVAGLGQINGLHFTSATHGWVAGSGGMLRQVYLEGTWKSTVMTLGIGATNLNDVSFSGTLDGVAVGDQGVVLRTRDGGATWVRLSGPATLDYTRSPLTLPTQGYIFGGATTGSQRFVGMLSTFAAQSVAFAGVDGAPPEAARWITIFPLTRNLDGFTDVAYSVSPNGGTTWYPVTKRDTTVPDVLGNVPYHPVKVDATPGTDILVKMELTTDSTFPYVSPEVGGIHMIVSHGASNDTVLLNAVLEPVGGPADPDSTAIYVPSRDAVRSPRIETFWNQLLGGPVLALDVGRPIVTASHNDARTDVLVGTGGTDRRVYALSGTNGAILWQSPQLQGPVRSVAFADLPHLSLDGHPDVVAVVEAGPDVLNCPGATTSTVVYLLDGRTGLRLASEVSPTLFRICAAWKGFAVTDLTKDGNTDVVLGQTGSAGNAAGYIHAVNGRDAAKIWRTVPSIKGLYTLEYEAPLNSLFGPYVVEVEVTGSQILPDNSQVDIVTRAVSYFLVTPPDRRMPVSPIYTVELVVWYDDWDFAPGAGGSGGLPPLPPGLSWTISPHPWFDEYRFN